jgi:hypothetical protein
MYDINTTAITVTLKFGDFGGQTVTLKFGDFDGRIECLLVLTQPLADMSARNISWGRWPVRRADNLTTFMRRLS